MSALHYSHTLFRIYTSLSQLGGSEAKGKKAWTSQIHSGEGGRGKGGEQPGGMEKSTTCRV